ncbi:MAG: diguanylate cyclase [Candidatus Omnitrophica bacterium]|nr:diguanylate cyclase [Candidatus Omnitrophota bacterium]
MFPIIILLFLAAILIFIEITALKKIVNRHKSIAHKLNERQRMTEKQEQSLKTKVEKVESEMSEIFSFYDLARKLAPVLDKKKLLDAFFEEIKYLGHAERSNTFGDDCFILTLDEKKKENIYVKTRSKKIIEYFSQFSKLLSLCVERISLYEKLQELSINDGLTDTYNRRYVMLRYIEEFKRAQKFSLNLSFLMIDIDYFKKINDSYGHLVGDVVLREVANIIKENIREIDFVARYGGEEFSVILPETDRAGAIMVAERIRAKISVQKIKAFDEVVTSTISVGVSSFPENTLHSDVLIEIADKSLYKAKLSGRNRVGWF